MNGIEDEQDLRQERVAIALERIAERLDQTARIERLEELLSEFVLLMTNPLATDESWTALLEEVQEALASES